MPSRRRRAAPRPVTPAALDELADESPLFDEIADLAYISISRDDPEEGYVGRVSPAATERDIARKFGGGTFTLSPRSSAGKYVKGLGGRVLTIAGDPIFQSRAAEAAWKRRVGLEEDKPPKGGAAQGGDRPMSIGELMLLMDRQAERSRTMFQEQAEVRERQQEQAHARQLELARADLERRSQEMKEQRERDQAAAVAERERQREHMALMIELVGKKAAGEANPIGSLMAGVKLAMDLKGGGEGGPTDPLTALADNLPEVLAQAGRLVGLERAAARPNPQQPAAPQPGGDEEVQLQGELGRKAARLVEHIKAQGRDPAEVLGRAFDAIGRTRAAPPPPRPPTAPASTFEAAAPRRAAARRPRGKAPKVQARGRRATLKR